MLDVHFPFIAQKPKNDILKFDIYGGNTNGRQQQN